MLKLTLSAVGLALLRADLIQAQFDKSFRFRLQANQIGAFLPHSRPNIHVRMRGLTPLMRSSEPS